MTYLSDSIRDDGLDAGLAAISAADNVDLHLCSAEPTSYAEALAYSLGVYEDVALTGPSDATGGGREVGIPAIDGLEITDDGDATHFALVDTDGEVLLAAQALAGPLAVIYGETVDLTGATVAIPGAV